MTRRLFQLLTVAGLALAAPHVARADMKDDLEEGDRYFEENNWKKAGAAYDHAALEAAMAHHRYDVQAAIYLLALHRLLRARLGAAYEPARQLGGALYFFLRGIDGPARGEYAIPATPALLALLDTLDHLLADEASLA